jgi:sarcosine oxidase subunit gamma
MSGEGPITLGDIPLTLAWNVRGNCAEPRFVEAANRLLGLAVPVQPNTSTRANGAVLLWMGPTSWMFVASAGSARPPFDDVRRAINDVGGALFDVSSSYVAWNVAGPAAGRVLNRGCPLDFHPDAFPAGHCAQSVLGHVTALFHRPDESCSFSVFVARSFARDAWEFLRAAAMTEGDVSTPAMR